MSQPGVSTEALWLETVMHEEKTKGLRLKPWKKIKGQGQGTKKGTAGKYSHDVQRPKQVSWWYPAPKMGLKEVDQQE